MSMNDKQDENIKQNKNEEKAITSRSSDYSQWYLDIISSAELADSSPVRGCMVIKPYGYAIWEKMVKYLDDQFKNQGVENAYFPLFIPLSFLTKEAEHVEGFAKEAAVVTHHRLESNGQGGLRPAGELEEPLVVRPTSETIIYDSFSRWIHSYRDLPLLINQWANVVRWEMRTRPFLRTTEFLWQEGHTAHATETEAADMSMKMLKEYQNFAENIMAIPVIPGRKSESEKFAGAEYTNCIEAMMQDKKALQAGTSHMLGQNFAKAFDVKFTNEKGDLEFAWQTSWGVSTRLIGALIMVHSDDKGLVLPPKLAPLPVVIVAVGQGTETYDQVIQYANELKTELEKQSIKAKVDDRELRPGEKYFHWEKRGVPIRIEVGPKDMEKSSVVMVRRDTGEKIFIAQSEAVTKITETLVEIQNNLYARALHFREENTFTVDSWEEFKTKIEEGGFLKAHWCGEADCEAQIKEETKATIRCIPFDQEEESRKCVHCGRNSGGRVIFAKAY